MIRDLVTAFLRTKEYFFNISTLCSFVLLFPCTYKIGETIISVRSADQDENSELPVIPVPGLPIAAEAYFSPDGKSLICNAKVLPDDSVHHVYTANIDGTEVRRINDEGEDA
ncbi:MAG: hypothetical protein IIB44_13085, partial [Candidatus Marinimicrobia bacterium]|nr:hypothetical protein [Candidatus Neomarinimicrobiota bacterium]